MQVAPEKPQFVMQSKPVKARACLHCGKVRASVCSTVCKLPDAPKVALL
jgi:hypothetical protein